MFDERTLLNGKSLNGYLMDMPDDDFRAMVARANMTALLNIQQMLHIVYCHTSLVKDALIQAIMDEPEDAWVASDTVAKLHVILLKAEARYFQVKEALASRDTDTDNAYWNLRNWGF